MARTTLRLKRQPSGTADADLMDTRPLRDAVNRLASSAEVLLEDRDGTKISDYPRGQRVEVEYSTDGGSTFTRRWAGFVQDRTRKTQGGVDRVVLQLVGYDHFLTTRSVFKAYTDTRLDALVEDVVKNFTPVQWVAANVTLENPSKTITRDFQGETPRDILSEVTSISADEDFGVNDDFEFFLEKRETQRAGRDITDGDWISYDLPEKGSAAVNRVELFYGAPGSRSRVIVEDRAAQRDLKAKLDASSNVVISKEVTFPEISNEDAAQDKANEILNKREPVLQGPVRIPLGGFEMDAGDVFRLQIGEKNLDADFRIAEILYHWTRGIAELIVAEDVADVEDLLVELSGTVQRVSARDADPDATFTQFLTLKGGVVVNSDPGFTKVEIDADALTLGMSGADEGAVGFTSSEQIGFGKTSTRTSTFRLITLDADTLIPGLGTGDTRQMGFGGDTLGLGRDDTVEDVDFSKIIVTNTLLNHLRDAWQGETIPAIETVAVGTGSSDPSVADTDLESQVLEEDTLRQRHGSPDRVAWAARILPEAGLQEASVTEWGIKDANGDLVLRCTFDEVNPSRGQLLLLATREILEDDPDRLGVITDLGVENLVDLLLGTGDGAPPTEMRFGTGTTDAATGDTSLESPIAASDASLETEDKRAGQTSVIGRLGTGEGNGHDISEEGEENSADEVLTRVVFEAVSKTSDFALETNHPLIAGNK